ncbi:peptide-methionine (R)-S-oxide reductase MsrB [Caulobacter sp. FWC2]|uniref:peptide-methionine (R)-S-oxide reductase MsrB n=1 Tax=Caulobacter sp. FWC2 TaxID=69664 RepID=UPI000C152282|nr:peptide-methionine (R)-S-oxide reductase MsrB [Caulobacter sp. FWC2]PIB90521.1 peptide-methionine (R)-S-oxide reductase [Caulobacter sp. FWC2]
MTTRRHLLATGGLSVLGAALGLAGFSARAETFEVTRSDAEWKRMLPPDAYEVLRHARTERAGTSPLDKNYKKGTYSCRGCDLPLFSSTTKFDSGTGWPSFWQSLPNATAKSAGGSILWGTEIHCRRCGGHLGHVFNDGPKPTGLRYCMNGVALTFKAA